MLHWIHQQWFGYWWPSDKGNGPENITWTAAAILATSLIYPPIRHYINREFEKVHHKIDHVISGIDEPYKEPEWERFEHWVSKLGKWIIKPFRKKAS